MARGWRDHGKTLGTAALVWTAMLVTVRIHAGLAVAFVLATAGLAAWRRRHDGLARPPLRALLVVCSIVTIVLVAWWADRRDERARHERAILEYEEAVASGVNTEARCLLMIESVKKAADRDAAYDHCRRSNRTQPWCCEYWITGSDETADR